MQGKKLLWRGVFCITIIATSAGAYFYFPGFAGLVGVAAGEGSAIVVEAWNDATGSGMSSTIQDLSYGSYGAGLLGSTKNSEGGSKKTTKASESAPTGIVFGPSSSSDELIDSGGSSDDATGDDSGADNSPATTGAQNSETPPASAAQPVLPGACSFTGAGSTSVLSREVILNEIAWMGSLPQDGETAAKAAEEEWIELKNITVAAVDISGWQILDSAGSLKITVTAGTVIPAGGFYLLARGTAYSGGLSNTGDELAVFDAGCGVLDFLDASAGWPGGDNKTKQTLERDADGVGWHTSALPGGTPGLENSVPAVQVPVVTATSTQVAGQTSTPAFPYVPTSSIPVTPLQYSIAVSSGGTGTGMVSSSPADILCGFTCLAHYPAGTKLVFAATPSPGSSFKGWSGACSGASATCSFLVTSSVSLFADFELVPPVFGETATAPDDSPTTTSPSSPPASSGSVPTHLVIAAVQIASAASSSNDFARIFNPTANTIDLSGWKLHKKSNTGTDSSLRVFPTGSAVLSGGYFVWANSAGGFADSIGADVSSTETLAADNSVALFDESGTIVDEVAWGTGTNQYVEGSPYPTDPVADQILMRKTSGGAIVDTDNNANDFVIQ